MLMSSSSSDTLFPMMNRREELLGGVKSCFGIAASRKYNEVVVLLFLLLYG